MKARVCHISTVHPTTDIRIFEKECQVLHQAGYEISFIVPHDQDENIRGVRIIALPRVRTRLARAVKNGFWALQKALRAKAQIYHFHDPELMPVGFFLSLLGKRVIYDIHEDLPQTILNKDWIPSFMRQRISSTFEKAENWCARRMSLLITATPTIRDRFLSLRCRAVDVNNYPMLSEFQNLDAHWNHKERAVCYLGSMDRYRGIVEMTQAIEWTTGKLFLAGTFSPASHRNLASQLAGWRRVKELGQLDRSQVAKVLARSMGGLVVIHPRPNYLDSLPIKMFEYMSAGIPVIASNFPLWQKMIGEINCGLCCDPLNPEEIARAIQWIFDHPEEARRMGENGRKAVLEKFNWESESKKLLSLYGKLLS